MKAVVIGDIMLDIFEEGRVDRISPEAPVPVLLNPRGHDVLGGAANAARNIASLGTPAVLMGLIGDDRNGHRCRALAAEGVLTDALAAVSDWRTVVKHRFLAGGQQMLRVDSEDPLPRDAVEVLVPRVGVTIDGASAVVLSDYDKGVVTEKVARAAIDAARAARIPVVVDSKRLDPMVFAGCTVIAPNLTEATRMTGTSDPEAAAGQIARMTESAVLVTLGAAGMLLYEDGRMHHIPSRVKEVADITGAGDSVTAGLTVALVEGGSLLEAAEYAAAVAAVAVEHKGTYAVQRSDLSDVEEIHHR
jgi:rfaE bifunctional protein kinase chain/domain